MLFEPGHALDNQANATKIILDKTRFPVARAQANNFVSALTGFPAVFQALLTPQASFFIIIDNYV